MIKRAVLILALVALASIAHAQTLSAVVVSACGTPPQTYTAGQFAPITMDTSGNFCGNNSGGGASTATLTPSAASANAVSHASVTSLGTSLVAKASAGNLYGFYCGAITGGSPGYCIAYNGSSVPGTGALTGANVLDSCYFSGAAGCSLSRTPIGANYSTGIVILISSAATPFTYTTGTDTGYIASDYK